MNPPLTLILRDAPLITSLGWTLLHFVWQGALCGAVAFILLRALAGRSATARYRVALCLFVVTAAAPVATLAWMHSNESGRSTSDHRRVAALGLPRQESPRNAQAYPPGVEAPSINTPTVDAPSEASRIPPRASITANPQHWWTASIRHASAALPWIVCGWVAGVVLLSLRMCGGWWWTRRLITAHGRPLGVRWSDPVDRLCRQLAVDRAVQFVESGIARAPLVIGWLRPVVVLPASIVSGLTTHEIECLLAHELAHIRRNDYLVNLGQCVVEVLLFYHPVVWWLSHRVRQERECVCDELAASVTGDRVAYSRALLSAAEIATRTPRIVVAATQGDLSQRVHALLGLSRTSGRASGWIVIGLAALVLVAVAGLNSFQGPSSDNADSTGQSSPAAETFLEGDVTLDPIAGVVVDGRGRPLTGVAVTLREGPHGILSSSRAPSETRDIARTTTNEQGRFDFHDVPYSSVFRQDGYPLDVIAVAPGKSIGWSHLGSWSPAEDSTSVRIVMREEASVVGRILDENGHPLPDATVRLKYLMSIRHVAQADLEEGRWPRFDDRRFVDTAWLDDAPSARTDQDGRFTLPQLPAGSGVVLEVAQPNFQLADAFAATAPQLDAENAAKMKRPVQTGEVQVQLQRGYVIHVQVVEDETGKPVAGARYPDYLQHVLHPPRLVADDEGRFDMQHLELPAADLYVYPPEGSSLLGAYVRINLPADEFEQDVTVRLPRGAVVSGWVLDAETEQGIEGVQLFARSSPAAAVPKTVLETEYGVDGAQAVASSTQVAASESAAAATIMVNPQAVRPIVTDSQGAFHAAVPPGQVAFRLWNVPGYEAPALNSGQSMLDAPVQAYAIAEIGHPVTDLRMELKPTPSVAGTVTGPDGVPLSDVEIEASVQRLLDVGTSLRTIHEVTDAEGRYQLDSLFDDAGSGPVDPIEVIFHDPDGNLGASILFDPPEEGDPRVRTQDIELLPLGAVTGRFINFDTGAPVPGVRVQLYKRDDGTRTSRAIGPQLTTDQNGRFRLDGAFPGGDHYVSVVAPGFLRFNSLETTFTAESEKPHDLGDIVLTPTEPPDVAKFKPIQAPDVSSLTADEAYSRLESQYNEDFAAYRRQLDECDSGECDWIVARREPGPAYATAMLELARRHPDTDVELRSLIWVVSVHRIGGSFDRVEPLCQQAADLLMKKYVDRAELADCVSQLMGARRKLVTETGWRLVNENPHDAVRGRALFILAEREIYRLGRQSRTNPGNPDEAIGLLERVVNEFGHVPHWRHGTLGKAAEIHLFKLQHLMVGGTVPEITGADLAGNEMKLSDFRGRVVVLNFWGSWCGPCIGKIPLLNRLAEEFGDDVAVLGIASDTPEDASQAAAEHGIAYRSWVDGDHGPIVTQWDVSSWPTTYVIDAEGVIRHINPERDRLRQAVWKLVQE